MSSDSSCSEDSERIKQAIDGEFLTEDLYANGKVSRENSKKLPKPTASLRHQNHEEVITNPFSIKVTPEFQKHVSKHLSKLLDEVIDDSEILHKGRKFKAKKNGRIKLLSSSEDYLTTSILNKPIVKIRKYSKGENLSEADYKERAKAVAVSAEQIFSQEETKHWAKCTKGKVEIIKLSDGVKKARY